MFVCILSYARWYHITTPCSGCNVFGWSRKEGLAKHFSQITYRLCKLYTLLSYNVKNRRINTSKHEKEKNAIKAIPVLLWRMTIHRLIVTNIVYKLVRTDHLTCRGFSFRIRERELEHKFCRAKPKSFSGI